MDPIIIIKARDRPKLTAELNNDPYVMDTESGCLCTDQFTAWIKEFDEFLQSRNQLDSRTPIILTLDNYTPHHTGSNKGILEALVNVNVNVRFLPPNTTKLVQPLDLGILEKWKKRVNRRLALYKLENEKDAPLSMVITTIREVWKSTGNKTFEDAFRVAYRIQSPGRSEL
ncbi:hypothetical protein H4R27_005707 [Coemansia aciculifera]|nr:hypothetical protein H4R27_005707 [Coemansia aciculifera]